MKRHSEPEFFVFFLFQFDFVVDVVDVVNVDIVVVVVAVVIVVFDFTLMAGPVLTFVPFFFLFYLSCSSDDFPLLPPWLSWRSHRHQGSILVCDDNATCVSPTPFFLSSTLRWSFHPPLSSLSIQRAVTHRGLPPPPSPGAAVEGSREQVEVNKALSVCMAAAGPPLLVAAQ